MLALRVLITRYLSDDPQPGWIEGRLTDVWGREWIFEDKPYMFSDCELDAGSTYPRPGTIPCEIVGRRRDTDGREVVTVDTESKGVESTTGETRFEVLDQQLVEEA